MLKLMTMPNSMPSPMSVDPEFDVLEDTYETLLSSYGIKLPASDAAKLYIRGLWRNAIHRSLLEPYADQLRADKLLP